MQLIRAINKANKSNNSNNNNNSTSQTTTNNSKVVIVAPPTSAEKSQVLQVSQNANTTYGAPPPVSPSASLPPLKKRTSIVKQSVPPPVPPRGSPRSKSKNSLSYSYNFVNSCSANSKSQNYHKIDRDKLKTLESMNVAESGNQKVKKWLESVEVPENFMSSTVEECDEFKFKSVRKLIESYSTKERDSFRKLKFVAKSTSRRISDNSLVKIRVENFNSLDCNSVKKVTRMSNETDSGIESSVKVSSTVNKNKIVRHQFSRDGEFV